MHNEPTDTGPFQDDAYERIRPGSRVTILDRFNKRHTGWVVMKGPAGWVINMGGKYGTPAIASPSNTVRVTNPRERKDHA